MHWLHFFCVFCAQGRREKKTVKGAMELFKLRVCVCVWGKWSGWWRRQSWRAKLKETLKTAWQVYNFFFTAAPCLPLIKMGKWCKDKQQKQKFPLCVVSTGWTGGRAGTHKQYSAAHRWVGNNHFLIFFCRACCSAKVKSDKKCEIILCFELFIDVFIYIFLRATQWGGFS